MIRELEQQKYNYPVYLFYSNKTENRAAYHQQLSNAGIADYTYVPVFTRQEGRIKIDMLLEKLTDLRCIDFYIVGTSGFLRSMVEMLQTSGVSDDHIHTDDFG
jgi:ferredoxin-NADP reductase